MSATLREFPTPPDFDIWFDWPLHIPDEGGILASTSDRGEQGMAKGQTRKVDGVTMLETQFFMETDVLGDNAMVTEDLMALLEFSESKMKHAVSDSGRLMAATIQPQDSGKVRVVTVADTDEILIGGRSYVPQRSKAGSVIKNKEWLPKGSQSSVPKPPNRG